MGLGLGPPSQRRLPRSGKAARIALAGPPALGPPILPNEVNALFPTPNQPQTISRLSGQNLPTYIQESLHQAGMAHLPAGEVQAIAQHLTHYQGPEAD